MAKRRGRFCRAASRCYQGGEHDVVKLLDFGLVKEIAVDAEAQLTGVSTLLGTPHYMAPESILDAGAADERSDIYALGAVAYFLLAGADVFGGKSVIELCIQHIHEQPESLAARVGEARSASAEWSHAARSPARAGGRRVLPASQRRPHGRHPRWPAVDDAWLGACVRGDCGAHPLVACRRRHDAALGRLSFHPRSARRPSTLECRALWRSVALPSGEMES
jgi:serine/threonine protein kinase